jgi:ribose transport system permease protein
MTTSPTSAAEGTREESLLGSALRNLPYFYIGAVALVLIAGLVQPNLLQPFLLLLILRQAAPLGIAVLGQSICIRLLSLDLSFGGVAMAVSYIMTSGVLPLPEIVLIGICLMFGAGVGAANAFFITRLRASSVIVTLAMTMILGGVVTAFTQLRAPGDAGEILRYFGQTRVSGLPIAVLVWLGLALCLAVFMRSAVFGRYVEAIGANPRAALASGIPYIKVMFVGHIMSSLFAVLSALLLLGVLGVGSLSIGSDLALNSLAAVILGGVTFGAGRGGVFGPTVAAFMLLFCFNFLTSLGLGEPVKQMAQGAIIAIAAIAYAGSRFRQR